jgi:hypothetical protein
MLGEINQGRMVKISWSELLSQDGKPERCIKTDGSNRLISVAIPIKVGSKY